MSFSSFLWTISNVFYLLRITVLVECTIFIIWSFTPWGSPNPLALLDAQPTKIKRSNSIIFCKSHFYKIIPAFDICFIADIFVLTFCQESLFMQDTNSINNQQTSLQQSPQCKSHDLSSIRTLIYCYFSLKHTLISGRAYQSVYLHRRLLKLCKVYK